MTVAFWTLIGAATLAAYTYAGYPLLLRLAALRASGRTPPIATTTDWPDVTITVAAYNEEHTIADLLDSLLRLDYPRERLEILVASDASTDRTDSIVRGYAARGVRLIRLPQRMGKTSAENAARSDARGTIIVNTDASVRIPPQSLRPLVAAFADPTVGVASGRDVSVAPSPQATNTVEAGYVGYEMWVRSLETDVAGIIGSSGCFFATRADVCDIELPGALSWDFAAPLVAKERGYRAVSVPDAVCHVPRNASLAREYRRKVRTVARGMQTLWYERRLLNPFRYGAFAWMLFSHKLCRWALPWSFAAAVVALGMLAVTAPAGRWLLPVLALPILTGLAGWAWPRGTPPRAVSLVAFLLAGNIAVLHATLRALSPAGTPTWEPTRRQSVTLPVAEPGAGA